MKGHIRDHGNGKQGIIYLGKDSNGKKKYKYLPVQPTKKQAEALVAQVISEMNRGTYVEPAKETTAEWLLQWLDLYTQSLEDSTRTWYRYMIEQHLIPAIGHIPLAKLTATDIQKCLVDKLNSGYSKDSIHGMFRVLRTAIRKAYRVRKIPFNIMEQVEPPAPKKTAGMALTEEQATRFLNAVKQYTPERYPLYLMATTTTMRIGEILGLRWKDVDMARGLIHIEQQLHQRSTALNPIFKKVKTDSSKRCIPMPQILGEALTLHKIECDMAKQALGKTFNPHGLVFVTSKGTPIIPRNLVRQFKELLKKAGLSEIRFHDLRHTGVTWLMGKHISPNVVAAYTGHSDPSFLVRKYGHVTSDFSAEPAQMMDKILRKKE